MSDRAAVTAFVAEAAGGAAIDVLVNNAGGVRGQVGRPIEEISEQDWHTIFDVNVTGAFYFAQAVAPGMKAAEARPHHQHLQPAPGSSISLTGIQAYASAKAAQIGLTRQLAHELGPWGITVNNVAPGFVRSNPTTERQWESYGEAGQRALVESIALQAPGRARGHRPRGAVLRVGLCRLDHRAGAVGRRREVARWARWNMSKLAARRFWTS